MSTLAVVVVGVEEGETISVYFYISVHVNIFIHVRILAHEDVHLHLDVHDHAIFIFMSIPVYISI
jgi:hypothetical protein